MNIQATNLLLSEPFMADPYFQRSAVLICANEEEEGTIGFVLNQPTELTMADLFDDLPQASEFPLFIGGPVAPDTLHFIHRCADRISDSEDLGNGVYWGGNMEQLLPLIKDNALNRSEIKFFLGYSGWGVGQMAEELHDNSWMVCESYNPEILFVIDGENLWREALIAMGPKYAMVANYPIDPRLN